MPMLAPVMSGWPVTQSYPPVMSLMKVGPRPLRGGIGSRGVSLQGESAG